jgi:hypothetical protein
MINEMSLNLQWWMWWSNPLLNAHASQLHKIPLQTTSPSGIDYYDLLRVRSIVDAPDLPDAMLEKRSLLKMLAFVDEELMVKTLQRLVVLTMDRSMLHARPQDWEVQFGVRSPETIRRLVQARQELPGLFFSWQDSTCTLLSLQKIDTPLQLNMQERVALGLGVYLKTFYPKIYQRWVLTRSADIEKLCRQLEKLPGDSEDVFFAWMQQDIEALWAEATVSFQEVELDEPEDEFDENAPEYAPLNKDDFFGGSNHA